MRRLRLSALLALALGAAAAPAPATAREGAITLNPARAEGVAQAGQRIGPFRITNRSRTAYRGRLLPVLLDQDRAGGLLVRTDAASVRAAQSYLDLRSRPYAFGPGRRASAVARLRRLTPEHNFYGGVLFRNEPVGNLRGSGIQTVLQLNAALLLRPPAELTRLRVAAERIRAASVPRRRLRLVVPIAVRGNTHVHARGALTIRRAGGKAVVRLPLRRQLILPEHTVELPALVTKLLPAGRYVAEATVTAADRTVRARGRFELFGPNQLATRDARLVGLASPGAVRGEPVRVDASFRNTGNVPLRPVAVAEIRRVEPQGLGRVVQRVPLVTSTAAPGERGAIRGEIPALPDATYDLEVRLSDGKRELDSRSVGFTPGVAPSWLDRIRDWLAAHPWHVLVLALGLIALVVAVFLRRERALRAAAAAADIPARRRTDRPRRPDAGEPVREAESDPAIARPAADPARAQGSASAPGAAAAGARPSVGAAANAILEGTRAAREPRAQTADPGFRVAPVAPAQPAGQPRLTDVNRASAEELARLPGVGRAAARRIVAHRERHGPFASIHELVDVEGFAVDRVLRLAEHATTDRPA